MEKKGRKTDKKGERERRGEREGNLMSQEFYEHSIGSH